MVNQFNLGLIVILMRLLRNSLQYTADTDGVYPTYKTSPPPKREIIMTLTGREIYREMMDK